MVHVLHFISILHLSQNYEVELHQKCLICALKIYQYEENVNSTFGNIWLNTIYIQSKL